MRFLDLLLNKRNGIVHTSVELEMIVKLAETIAMKLGAGREQKGLA